MLEQVYRWWHEWPDALVGIPTGEISGISVLDGDVDKRLAKIQASNKL